MRQSRRFAWYERGQALVEFVLVLPLLLLLLLGIAEFAIAVLSYNTLADAARQGARYGIVHPDDVATIEAVARDATSWLDQDALTFTVNSDMGARTVSVLAEYDLNLISGVVIEAVGGNPTVHLHAISTMQVEY
ncbi:MAG: pilus assembly protein [Anaerolineae bacterium]|nr:pilus assembly protein [Anaerolineae bacterium]